jgi:hypothetical protein
LKFFPHIFNLLLFSAAIGNLSCTKPTEVPADKEFGLEQELQLGDLLKKEIGDSWQTYGKTIPRISNPDIYNYLYSLQDSILGSGLLERSNDLIWDPIILDFESSGGSERYQAFSLPGGSHYYYAGILNYLEGEHQFAALMAKEMSHNDTEDPMELLLDIYGEGLILEVINGGQPALRQDMIDKLLQNGFLYELELRADLNSVEYLCTSSYRSGGLAEIYEKGMLDSVLVDSVVLDNPSILNQFFTFYILDSVRSDTIWSGVNTLGCSGDSTYSGRYLNFLDSLNN